MNANRLLALYEKVAEAPDAVPRLRRFVLDLAVRGKLVAQDPTDVPPARLLAQARKDLRAQVETVKRIRWKQTDPVSADEIDKEVPPGWVPARVNDTGLYINGLAFKPADWKQSGIPIIRIQNLTDPAKEFNYAEGDFPEEVMVSDGDILVSWSATLEAFKWDRGEGVLNQHIFRVIPHEGLADRDFLLLFLRHAIREMADSEHAHGLVMTHINRGPFLNHVVLIPPLAEQRRIVAKVDELMVLLDRLEAARTAREVTRDRLAAASLARPTASDTDAEDFPAHARFALDALPSLTTRPDQIKALRQTILNLAVRGKLVEQDSADGSGQALLRQILALPWKKKRKASDLEPDDAAMASAFSVPASWAWATVQALTRPDQTVTYGILKPEWVEDGVPTVRVTEMRTGEVDVAVLPKCRRERAAKFAKTTLEAGDLLVSKDGTIGKTAFVPPELAGGNITQHVLRFPICEPVDSRFVRLAIDAPFCQSWMDGETKGVALQGVNVGDFRRMPIPLPPLAEQQRIVAKVDALMALCDRLGAVLHTADTTRARLLEALLHETLSPARVREMEAAE